MTDFQLTSDHDEPSARGVRLTNWRDLEGRTVRHVCESPSGKHSQDVEAVLVFTDDCWVTVIASVEDACNDDASAHVDLCRNYSSRSCEESLCEYMSPGEMLEAQMINQGQCELLREQQAKAAADDKAVRVARLRKQAEDLEKSA